MVVLKKMALNKLVVSEILKFLLIYITTSRYRIAMFKDRPNANVNNKYTIKFASLLACLYDFCYSQFSQNHAVESKIEIFNKI